jgi:hypothetical protein
MAIRGYSLKNPAQNRTWRFHSHSMHQLDTHWRSNKLDRTVSAAALSTDYSHNFTQSATNNRITSRSSGGGGRDQYLELNRPIDGGWLSQI